MKLLLIILLCLLSPVSFSWSATGHRLIGFIAYQNLNNHTRQVVNHITAVKFHSQYPDNRFMKASIWPDLLRINGNHQYDHWHFINLPIIHNNRQTLPLYPDNIIWAIQHSIKELKQNNLTIKQQAWYLSFLLHLIGDASQPLHCATLYSTIFPNGDQGGNLFAIKSTHANNLHQLWDQGLGLWYTHGHYMRYKALKSLAQIIMKRYPISTFTIKLTDSNARHWVQRSHALALKYAYTISPETTPSASYIKNGTQVVMQQIAVAGYRAAILLNQIFSHRSLNHANNYYPSR